MFPLAEGDLKEITFVSTFCFFCSFFEGLDLSYQIVPMKDNKKKDKKEKDPITAIIDDTASPVVLSAFCQR